MKITVLLFGILRDVVGKNKLDIELSANNTLLSIKTELMGSYPKLNQYQNFSMAVNETYQDNEFILKENDIVALIPPVSGG